MGHDIYETMDWYVADELVKSKKYILIGHYTKIDGAHYYCLVTNDVHSTMVGRLEVASTLEK